MNRTVHSSIGINFHQTLREKYKHLSKEKQDKIIENFTKRLIKDSASIRKR